MTPVISPIQLPLTDRARPMARQLGAAAILALVAVAAAGCGASADEGATQAQSEAVKHGHSHSGGGTETNPNHDPQPSHPVGGAGPVRADCVKFLEKDHTYRGGWRYFTDDLGRPHIGLANNLAARTRGRTPCEGEVGRWEGNGYDGSHLIAATLDGISRRYNLVPMTHQANAGPMKVFENVAKACVKTSEVRAYRTEAIYKKNNTGIRPDSVLMQMVVQSRILCCGGGFAWKKVEVNIPNSFDKRTMTRATNQIKEQRKALGC